MNRYIELLLNTPPRFYMHMAKYKLAAKSAPENYDDIHPCVFVLSTGRAGTETLAHLIAQDKQLITHHEPLPKLFGLSKTCYELSADLPGNANLETALTEAFLTGRRDLLNYSLYTHRGYVETGPHVTFIAPLILKAIPGARFIHLVRNPTAVVQSGLRRNWYAGQINDQWRITPKPGSLFASKWNSFSQAEKNYWLWAETNQWLLELSRLIEKDKYMLLHAEDMFTANQEIIGSIYHFLGGATPSLARIRQVLRKQLNSQKVRNANAVEIETEKLDDKLRGFVSAVARELGCTFN